MKKNFYLTAVAIAIAAISTVSSCTKEVESPGNPVAARTDAISFVAVLDDDAARTAIDGTKIYWNDGDEVAVNASIFVATVNPENRSEATFTLKEGYNIPQPKDGCYEFNYPYSSKGWAAGEFNLVSTQTYGGEDISKVNPMYARTSSLDGKVQFRNMCGLLALKVKGSETIRWITVTANEGEYLSGRLNDVSYDEESGKFSYSSFSSNYSRSESVSLSCSDTPVQLKEDEATTFYIALPEKEYSSLTITFYTTDDNKLIFRSNKACPIVKNHIFSIPFNVDIDIPKFEAEVTITKNEAVSLSETNVEIQVTPTDTSRYYIIGFETKTYVDTYYSGEGEDYKGLARYDVQSYEKLGMSLQELHEYGYLHKGQYLRYRNLPPGTEMYVFVYSIDENFNVSAPVVVPLNAVEYEPPFCSAQYSDYLGDWVMGKDIIRITEKVNGSTYNVSGIRNQANYSIPDVEASFINGNIILREQSTDGTMNSSSYGTCDMYLTGLYLWYDYPYGHYPLDENTTMVILCGQYDNDAITVQPGRCIYGYFVSLGFSWVPRNGSYEGGTLSGTELTDMTRYVAPTGPTPEGIWKYTDDYDWSMIIRPTGIGYAIDHFDISFEEFLSSYGYAPASPDAVWNPSDSTLTVASGTNTGISSDDVPFVWTGVSGNNMVDIVYKFDFNNNTCTCMTNWGAYLNNVGWYTYYYSGFSFAKQEPAGSYVRSCSVVGGPIGVGNISVTDSGSIAPCSGGTLKKGIPHGRIEKKLLTLAEN